MSETQTRRLAYHGLCVVLLNWTMEDSVCLLVKNGLKWNQTDTISFYENLPGSLISMTMRDLDRQLQSDIE